MCSCPIIRKAYQKDDIYRRSYSAKRILLPLCLYVCVKLCLCMERGLGQTRTRILFFICLLVFCAVVVTFPSIFADQHPTQPFPFPKKKMEIGHLGGQKDRSSEDNQNPGGVETIKVKAPREGGKKVYIIHLTCLGDFLGVEGEKSLTFSCFLCELNVCTGFLCWLLN